jgi:hypothetical protein
LLSFSMIGAAYDIEISRPRERMHR